MSTHNDADLPAGQDVAIRQVISQEDFHELEQRYRQQNEVDQQTINLLRNSETQLQLQIHGLENDLRDAQAAQGFSLFCH